MKEFFLGFLISLIIITFAMLIKAIFEKRDNRKTDGMYAVIELDTGETVGFIVEAMLEDDDGEIQALRSETGEIYWRTEDEWIFTKFVEEE